MKGTLRTAVACLAAGALAGMLAAAPASSAWGAGVPAGQASYSLEDCFQAALKRSESLASQGEVVTQAEERFRQAIGSVLPSVVANGLFTWQNQSASNFSPSQQNTVKFTATQPLFQGLREYAALAETKDMLKSSKLAYQWAALQLWADTSQAFNLVLSQEKDLADLRNEDGLYLDRIRFLRGWLAIGRAQDTDVLSVQSAEAQVKAQMEQVKYQIASARQMLAFLTGLPAGVALDDTQSLPDPLPARQEYLASLDQRPDLKAARWNVEAAKQGVWVAWDQHLPTVSASADYYAQRPGIYSDINWDAALSVSMPLFMGGVIESQARTARSQARQAELALSQARRMDEQNLNDGYDKLRYDLTQQEALRQAADLAHKNYLAETRNFRRGLVTNLDVLQAMITDVTTQQALDTLRYAANTDYQSLRAQTGQGIQLPSIER